MRLPAHALRKRSNTTSRLEVTSIQEVAFNHGDIVRERTTSEQTPC